MRIIVKESTGENHDIKIPTGVALNRVTAGVVTSVLKKNGVALPKKQLLQLMKEAKKYKRNHPEWKLLEVEDADGEYVEITI